MLSFDILIVAHNEDLLREATHERLANEVVPHTSLRGRLARGLRAVADWIDAGYAPTLASKAASHTRA
jgi:hypothetical protein